MREILRDLVKMAALNKNVEFKDYQRRAVNKIRNRGSLLVAHGTGTGKTVTGIGGFELLKQDGKASKALVVVPASLRTNFSEHGIKKFTNSSYQVIDRGNQEVNPESDYLIVSSTLFAKDPLKYAKGRDTIIVDEAHNARNANSQLSKALEEHAPKFKNRIALTASPFNNRPADLAPLINFVKGQKAYDPSRFDSKYIREHKKRMGFLGLGGKSVSKEVFVPDAKLKAVLRQLVDYERGEEGLPSITEEIVRVPMTKEQRKAYRYVWGQLPSHVRRAVKADILPSKRDAAHFFAAIANARVASNNPASILEEYKDRDDGYLLSGKALQVLQDAEPQTMLYSNYNEHGAEIARRALESQGRHIAQITGKMNRKQKDAEVEAFKSGDKEIFITTPTGKEGISLPNVRKEIVLDPHWNPEVTRQAVGRGVRADSFADHINVRHYVAVDPDKRLFGFIGRKPKPSVEEWVLSVANRKKALQQQVLSYMGGE